MRITSPFFYVLAVAVFGFGCGTAGAIDDKVVVIVNSSNTQDLSMQDLKSIYTENLVTWSNGETIKYYELPLESDVREHFSKRILGMSAQQAAAASSNRKITNTSKNPPKTKRSKLVVSIVAKDPNAVGYSTESAVQGKSGLRVVLTLD